MRVLTNLPNLWTRGLALLLFICFCNSYIEGQVVISNCPVQEGTYTTQAEQDAAADGTPANPFATWINALAFAQTNNITTVTYGEGTYQTDFSVPNAFGVAAGISITLDGMTINGNNATIDGNGVSVGFASIEADNVSFNDLNLTAFAGALVIEDVQNFNYTNGVIDGSDLNGVNGVFISSDAVTTDATFTNVQFNNHTVPTTVTAMDIFASSTNPAINTIVTFNNTSWSCNQRDNNGGALFIGHGGGRIGGSDPGPIVTFNGGGFYDNMNTATNGGAIFVNHESTLIIDGTEFVCNESFGDAGGQDGGGAINNADAAVFTVSNANFSNNSANTGNGGAINSNTSVPVSITNTVFWNNTGDRGGAVYLHNQTNATITGSYFEDNNGNGTGFGGNGGGGIYINGGGSTIVDVINSTITDNNSIDSGAGGINFENGAGSDMLNITNSAICLNAVSDVTSSATVNVDALSVIGVGVGSQGDCAAIPVLVGYQGVPPAALVCPACPTIAMPANLCPVCITCDVYPWSGDN